MSTKHFYIGKIFHVHIKHEVLIRGRVRMFLEFGQHMAQQIEVSSLLMTLLHIPMLMFVYLFPCKI
jgi:hypothetical protein